MAKMYFKGLVHDITLEHGTDKAFYVDVASGRMGTDARNGRFWIPRSVCKIGEANENGGHEILVPQWLFNKNRIDYHRVTDINFGVDGKLLEEI